MTASPAIPVLRSFLLGALLFGGGCTVGEIPSEGDVADAGSGGEGGNTPDADTGGGGDTPDADPGAGNGPEDMTITFTTEPRDNERYSPKNIVAVWIQNANGDFIETIDRYSATRTGSLRAWNAVAPVPPVDTVSGATRNNHNTAITATWDIKAANVPDGEYTVRIETCESNANSPDDNAQATFLFTKNGTAASLTPTENNYSNVTIEYSGRTQ